MRPLCHLGPRDGRGDRRGMFPAAGPAAWCSLGGGLSGSKPTIKAGTPVEGSGPTVGRCAVEGLGPRREYLGKGQLARTPGRARPGTEVWSMSSAFRRDGRRQTPAMAWRTTRVHKTDSPKTGPRVQKGQTDFRHWSGWLVPPRAIPADRHQADGR